MKNVLLGKTVKAMYKLSGKTLQQLSDETELTIDTINNLFYARIQKPGFNGVCTLVRACGYRMEDLSRFLDTADNLPEDADITAEFTKYLFTVQDAAPSVPSAESCTRSAADTVSHETCESCCQRMNAMQEEHERQLEQVRTANVNYVEQLSQRYREQIEQMDETADELRAHYDHSVGEIKKAHAEELGRQTDEIRQQRRMNLILTAALIAVCVIGMVLAWVMRV